MPNLSIKDVPEAWAEALRQRAARNHRSLQGELMALVEAAALESAEMRPAQPAGARDERGRPRMVGYDKHGWPIIREGWMSPEQFCAEMHKRSPQPNPNQSSSVDLIREDRDSR